MFDEDSGQSKALVMFPSEENENLTCDSTDCLQASLEGVQNLLREATGDDKLKI